MYSTADKWEGGDTKQSQLIMRTKKIRIYPNKQQATTLKKWFGTSRYLYNKIFNYNIFTKN